MKEARAMETGTRSGEPPSGIWGFFGGLTRTSYAMEQAKDDRLQAVRAALLRHALQRSDRDPTTDSNCSFSWLSLPGMAV
ncbi:hypothetical protein ACFFX0_18460 [Citricoccus parietis]|uniref:Uncharacterized protein n=1 Tax=Citricoccus parietis TaxID=592307 RepID=A0ABV5G3N6_9MICC